MNIAHVIFLLMITLITLYITLYNSGPLEIAPTKLKVFVYLPDKLDNSPSSPSSRSEGSENNDKDLEVECSKGDVVITYKGLYKLMLR